MYVTKRDGRQENISFDKVLRRIRGLCIPDEQSGNLEPLRNVNYDQIARDTIRGIYPGVSTRELDELASSIAQPLAFEHPEYGQLAARILISNHQKNTIINLIQDVTYNTGKTAPDIRANLFKYTATALYNNTDESGNQHPLIAPDVYAVILANSERLEKLIDYNRDYNYDFMGFKTLEESYLQKCSLTIRGPRKVWQPIERPQHMIMRVALGLHCSTKYRDFNKMRQDDAAILAELGNIVHVDQAEIQSNSVNWAEVLQQLRDHATPDNRADIIRVKTIIAQHTRTWAELVTSLPVPELTPEQWNAIEDTYNLMSQKFFTHATPTIFNAGTLKPQLSSCFLVQLKHDSMSGITDYWRICAEISKYAGGIGSHVHLIRSEGSYIRGTNGRSNGLVPMLKVVNDISTYVDQCFHPDTFILTQAGLRKAGELTEQTRVVTHDGSWQSITAVREFHRSDHRIIKVRTWNSIVPVYVTSKHPVLCLDRQDLDFVSFVKQVRKRRIKPIWVEAGRLNSSHYIATPVPDFGPDQIAEPFESIEDCRLYGNVMVCGQDTRFAHLRKDVIDPAVYRLPKDHAYAVIQGIIESSGMTVNEEVRIKIRPDLAESLKYLLLKYRITSGSRSPGIMFISLDMKLARLLKIKDIRDEFKQETRHLWHDCLYSQFIDSDPRDLEDYDGPVVDFDVSVNPNYLTSLGIAHNGGGKRPGSHVIYFEPTHPDVFKIVSLKKPRGNEAERARNLFYGLWTSDEFMRTIQREDTIERELKKTEPRDSGQWYLICPDMIASNESTDPLLSTPLSDLYDEELRSTWIPDEELFPDDPEADKDMRRRFAFTYAYRSHIRSGRYTKKVSAVALWRHICEVIEETGIPYILFKDSCNRKSNQKNLGTIKSSNLCTEIVEYSSVDEVAVCNLASINVSSIITDNPTSVPIRYVDDPPSVLNKFETGFETSLANLLGPGPSVKKYIDWMLLERIVRRIVRNLNRIIDINFYPIIEALTSNIKHRPMAIGIQDFAHLLSILRLQFDSDEAHQLNFYLFEFIYYIALDESAKISKAEGPYESFQGSPASRGQLQFDLWEQERPGALKYPLSLDWEVLRSRVRQGIRNSLLIGPMPTGSTSTVLGSTPCFEPFNGLVMKRRNKSGEHYIADRYLINDLIDLGLWTNEVKTQLMLSNKGSIADIIQIPRLVRNVYKTVWDMETFAPTEMALIRAPFIDQSQSLSIFMAKPNLTDLTKYHYKCWRRGAKTSSYYTRRLAVVDAAKIQVEQVCSVNGDCKSCSG